MTDVYIEDTNQGIKSAVKKIFDQIKKAGTSILKSSNEVILQWKILNSNGDVLLDGSFNSRILPFSSVKLGNIDVSAINKESMQKQNNIILKHLIWSMILMILGALLKSLGI